MFFHRHAAPRNLHSSLHDALPIYTDRADTGDVRRVFRNIEAHPHVALRGQMINFVRLQVVKQLHQIHRVAEVSIMRSEEHTSELQSRQYLVCRLLLEKKNKKREDS